MTHSLSGLLVAALVLAVPACVAYAPAPGPLHGEPQVQVDIAFYDALAPFGEWLWVDLYGWIWVPRAMPALWQPYTYGYWVYTTYGWTWVSDWEWGWAAFHYGRWMSHGHHGWAWMPGYVWAPAWVSWRFGDGWVGWAPLPPEALWSSRGLAYQPTLAADWWVFVADRDLESRTLRDRITFGDREPGLVERTRPVTRYEAYGRDAVRDRGLDPVDLERSGGVAVPRYRIEETPRPPAVDSRTSGNRLKVYRPPVRAPEPSRRRPVQREPPDRQR